VSVPFIYLNGIYPSICNISSISISVTSLVFHSRFLLFCLHTKFGYKDASNDKEERGQVNEPVDEQSEYADNTPDDDAQVEEENTQYEQEETDLAVQGDETQNSTQAEYEEQDVGFSYGEVEAQEESNQVEVEVEETKGVDSDYVVPSVTYNSERKFAGGAVEPDEDELHRLDSFFSDINQNAPLEDELKGAQSVIENPSYTQLLTASTFEEIEVYSTEYTESCKVVIYKLHESLYIALAWQNNTENNGE
jgi:hypothetical protein